MSKEGQLELIEPWTIVVHVATDDSYKQLHDLLSTKDLLLDFWSERHSIGWRYDKKTEEEQSNRILEELSRQMADTELMAYRHDDCTIDCEVEEYARVRNGQIEWLRTDSERLELMGSPMMYATSTHKMLTSEAILFSSDEEFKRLASEANRLYEQEEEGFRQQMTQRQAQKQDMGCDDFPF